MDDYGGRCTELEDVNIFNFVISLIILIGILISYLPQHYRIIARRSSEGLSPYFILLGCTSGTFAISNILTLPRSRIDIACCAVNDAFSCAAGLLGIAQITVQWACFFLVTLLFLIFIPRNRQDASSDNPAEISDSAARTAVAVVAIAVAHFIITFILCVAMLARFPQHMQSFANFLGICSSILASIQYIPQIWTTWKLQDVKSLSIPMMCIQTPGSFVWVVSLAIRLGADGWSAWTVYLVTGTLQACLLGMGIYFILRDRKLKKVVSRTSTPSIPMPGDVSGDESHDERSPLLRHPVIQNAQNPSITYVSLNGRPPDDTPTASPANTTNILGRSDTTKTSLQRFFTSRTSQE